MYVFFSSKNVRTRCNHMQYMVALTMKLEITI